MARVPKIVPKVTLNGVIYGLDSADIEDTGDSHRKQFPQDQFREKDRNEFWQEWVLSSFHGGERLPHLLDFETDNTQYRYHDAEGVDVNNLSNWGELKLQPSLDKSYTIQSATMPMTVSADGTTLIVGLDKTPFIKKWTYAAGWADASSVAGTGAVTDLITAGSTYYGVRNGACLSSTNAATWSALGSYNTAVGIAYVNGDVYVGKSDGVYNHTKSEAVTTIGCSVICGYRENVYFGKDSRLYRYDGRAVYLYDQLPNGFNLTALIPYRQVLFMLGYFKVRGGYKGAVYYIISGSEAHLYSLGDYSADHRIYALAGGDDEVWVASPKRGGADRYDLEVGGIACGPAWGAAGYIPYKSMAVCEGYLWIGRYDNAVSSDGIYRADIASPTAYKTSGWLTTAETDFGESTDLKIYRDITVHHRALLAGQSVTVYYSIDGGTTYVQAGVSNIIGSTSRTFTLSDVRAATFKLRLNLAGGGTNTPTLVNPICVVRAVPVTDAKWVWQLRFLLLRSWGSAVATLREANDKQSQLSFTDIDGTTYTVVIDALQIEDIPDKKQDGTGSATAIVQLRQV